MPSFNRDFRHFRNWWNQNINSNVAELAERAPEQNSYPIGVTITDLQGVGKKGAFHLPVRGMVVLDIGWNYFDALFAIMGAANIFLDDTNYHHVKYFQAVLNMLSGAQGLAFTYCPPLTAAAGLSAFSLAGPAFAFMMLCDLINSAIDFYFPAKEMKFKGWLHERIKEVNYLFKHIWKTQMEVLEIQNAYNAFTLKSQHEIASLQLKMNALIGKRDQILKDIACRCRVYLHNANVQQSERNNILNKMNMIIVNVDLDNQLDMNINKPPSQADLAREAEIVKELEENFKAHRLNLIMKALSFTGMLLLAIAPFTGPAAPFLAAPGLVIVTIVAGYYIYKHREQIKEIAQQIADKVSVVTHSIFNKQDKIESTQPTQTTFANTYHLATRL